MQFLGFNAHLLNRKKNKNLLELQLGNEYRKDMLTTQFSILEDKVIIDNPIGYQNKTQYQVNDLYFKSKYYYKLKNLALIGKLGFHQLSNRLENNESLDKENIFFINPSIGFDWKINEKNNIKGNYSNTTTNAEVLDIYSDFVLTGYRSFAKGTNMFNQLNATSLVLNYELGNWSDRFFANTFVQYYKNHDFFSNNTTLNQNFTQAEKILIKDRVFFNVNATLDYYFKDLLTNLKLNLGYNKSEFKNIVNNSGLRKVISKNYNYGLELRSGFKGFFNYHLGTNWSKVVVKTSINNSYKNNNSFLDLSFVINNNFNFKIKSESYYFDNLEAKKRYNFLDFEARYKLVKNKLTLGFTGQNLFNIQDFKSLSINDIGSTTTAYRLMPRLMLLKMEYRF